MIGPKREWHLLRIHLKYELDISPQELRGGVALLCLILVFGGFRRIYSNQQVQPGAEILYKIPAPIIPFDPDTVNADVLQSWGVSSELTYRWINYRKAIGGFKTSEQVKKLYGMSDSLFSVLLEYMVFENRTIHVRRCPEPMDINLADSALLRRLHGIGGVLSARIIRYRELLGGFVLPEQVSEVYGISDSTWLHIRDRLYVGHGFEPKKINLDTASYREMYDHPYISSKEATSIIRYREQHNGTVLLRKIISFDSVRRKRLMPYVLEMGVIR